MTLYCIIYLSRSRYHGATISSYLGVQQQSEGIWNQPITSSYIRIYNDSAETVGHWNATTPNRRLRAESETLFLLQKRVADLTALECRHVSASPGTSVSN